MSLECNCDKNQTCLEKLNQPYYPEQQLKAYNTLRIFYPKSIVSMISMESWFNIVNETMRIKKMSCSMNSLFLLYKKEIEKNLLV